MLVEDLYAGLDFVCWLRVCMLVEGYVGLDFVC